MCIPNMEFQLVNPTTQVALFSSCFDTCQSLISITWNVYTGLTSGANKTVQWTKFNQSSAYQNIWFFGKDLSARDRKQKRALSGANTSNFTAAKDLFIANPQVPFWRFEVVYLFANETSTSALNFVINEPPANGTCAISPSTGTTSTLFTLSCPNWFDKDGVGDYSLYSKRCIP